MFINCWKGVIMNLVAIIDQYLHEDVMIAFSGGVDSTLLLKMAVEASQKYHTRVYAVTIQTALHPVMEADEAKRMAEEIGAIHKVIHVDELEGAGIENNPVDRCYLCKKYMFTKVKELAHSLGISTILEGTNADDLKQYRPGIKAIKELGLHSPLLEANMTKKEIRELAEKIYFGEVKDITKGATHFHSIDVNPRWSAFKTRTLKVGRHIFYRKPENDTI